jgi:hypothetical protein
MLVVEAVATMRAIQPAGTRQERSGGLGCSPRKEKDLMIGMLVVVASMGAGDGLGAGVAAMYDPSRDPRPIATVRGGDVNGRLFISRPLIGPRPGPEVGDTGSPGVSYYGAVEAADAAVPVRVGHLVVSISPWERIDKPGLQRFEEARTFWLHENNYTGGVRTFINDLHVWEPPQPGHVEAPGVETIRGLPQPRATIQINPDVPRQRRPLRVDADDQSSRISWPLNAPAQVVERASARGAYTVAGRE